MLPVRFRPAVIILAAFSALFTACGGGANTPVVVDQFPVTVSVNPSSAMLQANASLTLSAAVSATQNQGITWTVNGIPGGSPAVGVITTAGVYTAPARRAKAHHLYVIRRSTTCPKSVATSR